MRLRAAVAVTLCLCPLSSFAEDSARVSVGDFLLSKSPATAPSYRLEYGVASEVDFDAAAGGFSYERIDLNVPVSPLLHINDRHAITLGINYEAVWLDSDTFLGDRDLTEFLVNVRWMYRNPGSKWSWTAVLSPGLATDGEGISSDDLILNGQVAFQYKTSSSFAWNAGVVFFHNSLETRVYPGIGFQWRPTDDIEVRYYGLSLRASWQPHDDWLIHGSISSGGGTWNVENNGGSFDVKLQSYQAVIGVERRLSEKFWLGIWGGATLANDLEIETASGGLLFNQNSENGWFVKLGLRRVVW